MPGKQTHFLMERSNKSYFERNENVPVVKVIDSDLLLPLQEKTKSEIERREKY